MNYIEPIYKEVLDLRTRIEEVVITEMYQSEDKIRKWITDRWTTGMDSNGNLIGFYRFEDYAEYKYALSSLAGFGNVDLTLTGAMGRAIEIIGFDGEFEIFSTVGYYDEIVEKYGTLQFNITDKQQEMLFDAIWSRLFEKLNNIYK